MSGRKVMTQEGFDDLFNELDHLKKVELPDIISRVAEARAEGDLKENAEYHAAREKQGHIQDRIHYLETTLSGAQVLEKKEDSDSVVFGSQVTIVEPEDMDDPDMVEEYTLVGADESDPTAGKISVTSPIGKALLGHAVDDIVTAHTPNGPIEFKILKVQ
ncbi:transcription elongation factor GreA [Chitinivibrio alkaliphilus]|uniref:Transcription elongation factor GreA n=1 Tax=Chitinivibrio alkaliphilus ACht1 TaxID=1313304 RepID=U7DAK9_9BACT|nr:transcription elongation factor GreA [Chitinivibrio alkaliphilus]ERP31430.1 transcription elongation factor GreA [Chitinivibrio alkaliphilus ACht1]